MNIIEGRLRCSACGESVSSEVHPAGEFYCRAWVECPECIGSRVETAEKREAIAVEALKVVRYTDRSRGYPTAKEWMEIVCVVGNAFAELEKGKAP